VPFLPLYSGVASLSCSQVQTIEVGNMTVFVPPSTFEIHSTITTITIIVAILGSELHLIVISKGITCVTF
jgi:hypothetical protein